MTIPSPLCFLRGAWWSLRSMLTTGYRTEGHVYQRFETHEGVTVHVDRCSDCGRTQLSWHAKDFDCHVCTMGPDERFDVQVQP